MDTIHKKILEQKWQYKIILNYKFLIISMNNNEENSNYFDSNIVITKGFAIFAVFIILFLSFCMNILCVLCIVPKCKTRKKKRLRTNSISSIFSDSSEGSTFLYD